MTPEELKSQIHEIIENCIEVPIDNLVSNPRWGELNFEGARDDLERAFSILNHFLTLPIDKLPIDEIQSMVQSLRSLQNTINEIKSFDLKSSYSYLGEDDGYAYDEEGGGSVSGYDIQERDIIVKNLKRKVDNFYKNAQPWISYLTHHKSNIQRSIEKLASAAKEAEQMVTDADQIIVAAKQASVSVGAGKFTRIFFDEAKTLEESAARWLRVAVLLSVLSLAIATEFYYSSSEAKDGYAAVQLITTRLIIFSVLLSATVWCGRIYKALMHQVTINRHRANSVKIFRTFTEAASSDIARDAVLTEVMRVVFGSSTTGYLDKETASSGGDQLKVVEVVRQTSKALKPGSDQ